MDFWNRVRLAIAGLMLCGIAAAQKPAPKFYADDPIWREPPPRSVSDVRKQQLNPLVDFYKNTAKKKGLRNSASKVYPSQGINTLGEVRDSTWYTNRHDLNHRLSTEELQR